MAADLATSSASFEADVLTSELPVLVDFWAQWCRPCLALGPTVEALAEEFAGKMVVKKLDTESAPDLTANYGVINIPALLIFKGGKEVDRMIGNYPKEQVRAFIERNI